MRVAIIGFQKSGKTTVFNALTGQRAETSAFVTGRPTVNQAIVKIPDPRLDQLTAMFKPKKHTPATVEYVDVAGIAREEGSAGEGLGDKLLVEIGACDALLAVVRGFADPAAGAPPDIGADVEAMNLEMGLSDLKKVDNRLERIEKGVMKVIGKERTALQLEQEAVARIKTALEEGKPARTVELSEDQLKAVRGYQLLTMKPVMFLVNDGETEWGAAKDQPVRVAALDGLPATMTTRLCGLTEMEIAQLPEAEKADFLASYGIAEPAAHKIIRLCYELLGLMSFLTVGPDECRAWTIRTGTLAPQAAGAVHSDLERGFIRAEVVRWDELVALGSLAEARKHGKLRVEGKHYVVQDGDVVNILFSA